MRFISVISIHCTRKDFYNVKLEQEDNIEKSILAGEIRTIKKFRKERKPKFQVLKISQNRPRTANGPFFACGFTFVGPANEKAVI